MCQELTRQVLHLQLGVQAQQLPDFGDGLGMFEIVSNFQPGWLTPGPRAQVTAGRPVFMSTANKTHAGQGFSCHCCHSIPGLA